MNPIPSIRFAALLTSSLLLIAPARAIVPEPGNIYYGLALDFFGEPLEPDSGAQVVLVRDVAGEEVELARSPILSIYVGNLLTYNYVLRPSLDDGIGGRYLESATRIADEVAIFVEQDGQRFGIESSGACVSLSDPVPAIDSRGSLHPVDLRAIDDLDGDCMADSWEFFYFGTTFFDGTDDLDGDERIDLDEFYLGSNPLFPDTGGTAPTVLGIARLDDNSFQVAWEREPGVDYAIEWSETLTQFQPVPESRISGADGDVVDTTGFDEMLFFRVRSN